jgi:hypothetical protein
MSESITFAVIAELVTRLSPAEQRQLAENIMERLSSGTEATASARRAWREICGSVTFPLGGEDAQAWVIRGRQESEQQRQQP